jgi:hypothetical protein
MFSPFSVEYLTSIGFTGFASVAQLGAGRCRSLPRQPGVYVVMRDEKALLLPLESNPGGRFKGSDPTVPVPMLRTRWIERAPVLYIGKANQLQRRLQQYMDFGAGKPVGHWGGRLIWQVDGSKDFVLAWAVDPEPLAREAELIRAFVVEFGAMPFANLRR